MTRKKTYMECVRDLDEVCYNLLISATKPLISVLDFLVGLLTKFKRWFE